MTDAVTDVCTCGPHDLGWKIRKAGCVLHVECDDSDCRALERPVTMEEILAALEHWRDHGYNCGCSHGR